MEFTTASSTNLATQRSACLIVAIYQNKQLSDNAKILDEASKGFLSQCLKHNDMIGKAGEISVLYGVPHVKADRVMLVGCGLKKELDETTFGSILDKLAQQLKQSQVKSALCCLTELPIKGYDAAWKARFIAEKIRYNNYEFNQLKTKKTPKSVNLEKIALLSQDKQQTQLIKQGLSEGQAIANGMELARDLGNLPANICTPTYLAKQAKKISQQHASIKTSVLDEADMKKLKMGALLSVSRGSKEPAKLITIEYQGTKKSQAPVVLVGKGVTFDSGGISLKPSLNMEHMKYDMGGAASVLGTLLAIAELKLPINVVGIVPATENMPSGQATKPGDVVTSMSGQTIEVINTDAEGRLILCDALTYCKKFKPAVVIDIATLTGAILVGLGTHVAGAFTQNDQLANDFIKASEKSRDLAWRMPLLDVYQSQIDSKFADICNSGGRYAGSITAACFLARFTEEYNWMHLDVAGTAMSDGKQTIASGRPVPSLTQYLLDFAKK